MQTTSIPKVTEVQGITVTPHGGLTGNVALSCSGNPSKLYLHDQSKCGYVERYG